MDKINIIELIENNQINNLDSVKNNKLLEKIKKNLNQDEQNFFISTLYFKLNHDQKKDFVIDLDDIWTWLGFSQKSNCKRLLEKHFILNKDYKKLSETSNLNKEGRGGHNKEKIFLTILTFKKLCLKADTKKSDEIHDFYIKIEQIMFEIITEQNEEFVNEIKNLNKKIVKNQELNNHDLYIETFSNHVPLIYLVKVKSYDDETYIIKIIENNTGISDVDNNKKKYDEYIILDCFPVFRCKDFYNFLLTHLEIKTNNINNLKEHEKECGLVLIGKELSFNRLIQIINQNITNYNQNLYLESVELLEKLKEENKNLKLANQMNDYENQCIKELIVINKKLTSDVSKLENSNKEIIKRINQLTK